MSVERYAEAPQVVQCVAVVRQVAQLALQAEQLVPLTKKPGTGQAPQVALGKSSELPPQVRHVVEVLAQVAQLELQT